LFLCSKEVVETAALSDSKAEVQLEMLRSAVIGVASTVALRVDQAVSGTVNETLDRVVPPVLAAVLDRLDLTRLVIERVDLTRVVQATLDQMDLTQLVLDRVDVDRIVDKADLDRIIDRLPLVDLANYIVDEVDLPRIIRESTGGIATDAMNAVRIQTIGVDQMLTRITDAMLLRRKARVTTAPGEAAHSDDVQECEAS
jgi:hypothetical protein